jgi:hypothetical protein
LNGVKTQLTAWALMRVAMRNEQEADIMQFQEMTFTAAIHAGQAGERWKASAACARVPTPHAAISLLRSTWCKSGLVTEAFGGRPRRTLNDDIIHDQTP